MNQNISQKHMTNVDFYIHEYLLMDVLTSNLLQSDKKIKTLTDTAELIEDAVSANLFNQKLTFETQPSW